MDYLTIKCCWGFTLKEGSYVTLAINLILETVFTGLSVSLLWEEVFSQGNLHEVSGFFVVRDVYFLIANLLGIIFSIVGICAVVNEKANGLKYCIYYFCYDCIYFLLALFALLDAQPEHDKIFFFHSSSSPIRTKSLNEILFILLAYVVEIAFALYTALVLFSFRRSLIRRDSQPVRLNVVPSGMEMVPVAALEEGTQRGSKNDSPSAFYRFKRRALSVISEHTTPSSSERDETAAQKAALGLSSGEATPLHEVKSKEAAKKISSGVVDSPSGSGAQVSITTKSIDTESLVTQTSAVGCSSEASHSVDSDSKGETGSVKITRSQVQQSSSGQQTSLEKATQAGSSREAAQSPSEAAQSSSVSQSDGSEAIDPVATLYC